MLKRRLFILVCFTILVSPHLASAGNEGTVALVMKALSNPFFLNMQAGAKEYADKHHIPLEVFGIERETEVERQISIVESLISRGYGAIVIAPADSKKLIPVCKKATEKGIVVVNIDNPFHETTLQEYQVSIPFVGSDNRAGAALVGDYIKHKLANTGNAIIIEGIRGVENAELRKRGFIEALTSDSQIEVVASESANWHTDEAFSVVTTLLQKHEAVDAVLCANDNMALGVIQALDMLGLTDQVWVGAYDNIDEARAEMRHKRMHATIEQHPELMGEYGVALAADALAGGDIPDYTPTPLDLITYESFDKTIGLSISNIANPFFASLQRGAQKAADLFGIRLLVTDAADDEATQLVDLQSFIQEPVDLILLNPTHAETVSPAIEIAHATGIQVITVDRKSSQSDIVLAHVASDNIAGGRMAGEFIAQHVQGSGTLLEIEGIPGTSAAHDRGRGFNEIIETYPDIEIVAREVADFDRTKAREITQRLLEQGFACDAVFAHNDEMILGVLEAYEAAHIPKPSVLVGFDAIPEAVEAVQQKRLTATIAQKPEDMGWQAVQAAVLALRGEKLPPMVRVDLKLVQ